MDNFTDAESLIKTLKPGTMLYGRVKQTLDGPWETVFYIREDNQHIKWLQPNPTVEMRVGVLQKDKVYLVPVMIKIGGEYYESWLNYYATGDFGKLALQDLVTQEQNVLLFFGDSLNQDRSIAFKNSCRKTLALILEGMTNKPEWDMAEFNNARENIYEQYPKLKDLWGILR